MCIRDRLRDYPSINGTSRLSPYIRSGQIHVSLIGRKCNEIKPKNIVIKKYVNDELGWSHLDIYPAVLYGGSVNLDNCEEIISSNDVDGLLIGGASLNSETFSKIYNLS